MIRRYTFKLYPTAAQAQALDEQRRLHCALYNAALQERIDHYRHAVELHGKKAARGLTYYDQARHLKHIRADDPAYAALSASSMEMTLDRLDLAFKAFFRRAKAGAGASSGYPKFKASDLYPGFSFRWKKGRPNGCEFETTAAKAARLRLKGVPGWIKLRGRFPALPEKFATCDVMLRAGTWWLSVVVELPDSARPIGNAEGEIRFNLIDSFAVVRTANGGHAAGPEDVFYSTDDGRIITRVHGVNEATAAAAPESGSDRGRRGSAEYRRPAAAAPESGSDRGGIWSSCPADSAAAAPDSGGDRGKNTVPRGSAADAATPDSGADRGLQQAMSRCKRGSNRYRKLRRIKARREAKAARRRRENMHLWTTGLARRFGKLTVVKPPSIREATASGKGDEREWGAAVETKAALNRHVLSQAPALAIQMIEYKLAERGGLAEILSDEDAPVKAGDAVVRLAKASRRTKRSIKREKELLHA